MVRPSTHHLQIQGSAWAEEKSAVTTELAEQPMKLFYLAKLEERGCGNVDAKVA